MTLKIKQSKAEQIRREASKAKDLLIQVSKVAESLSFPGMTKRLLMDAERIVKRAEIRAKREKEKDQIPERLSKLKEQAKKIDERILKLESLYQENNHE